MVTPLTFREDWVSKIELHQDGGRDIDGVYHKGETVEVTGLVDPVTSTESIDHTGKTATIVDVYIQHGHDTQLPSAASSFTIPEGRCAGRYQIEGRPAQFPLGSVIRGRWLHNAHN